MIYFFNSSVLILAPASTRISDAHLADTMIGKAVEHMFETEEGSKDEWRGMVLARAPIMNTWFYITYEKDPVLYMYQLLDDYKDGDLRIMPDSSEFQFAIKMRFLASCFLNSEERMFMPSTVYVSFSVCICGNIEDGRGPDLCFN